MCILMYPMVLDVLCASSLSPHVSYGIVCIMYIPLSPHVPYGIGCIIYIPLYPHVPYGIGCTIYPIVSSCTLWYCMYYV